MKSVGFGIQTKSKNGRGKREGEGTEKNQTVFLRDMQSHNCKNAFGGFFEGRFNSFFEWRRVVRHCSILRVTKTKRLSTGWAKKKAEKNIQLKPTAQNGGYKIADAQIVVRCTADISAPFG